MGIGVTLAEWCVVLSLGYVVFWRLTPQSNIRTMPWVGTVLQIEFVIVSRYASREAISVMLERVRESQLNVCG